MKKIVLLSDSEIITQGMISLFRSSKSFQIVGECSREEQVKETLARSKSDILIASPHLLSRPLAVPFREIYGDVIVIALVYHYFEQSYLREFDGVIEINDSKLRIKNIIKRVIEEKEKPHDNLEKPLKNEGLSDREKEVLIAIATGASNKETAAKLNISIFTVISHRRNIIEKTGIKSVAGLTVYALMNNLIDEKDIF